MLDAREKYERQKAREDKENRDELEKNPLLQYSTSELKAELRRRKREGY